MFKNNKVNVNSVEEFLEKYYQPERYHGRGEKYAAILLTSHKADFQRDGFDIISRHDSITGQVVAYFGTEGNHV